MREGIRRWGMRVCWAVMLGSLGALGGLRLGRPLYYTDGSRTVFAATLADASMLRFGSPQPVCELPGPVAGRVAELPDGRLLYGRTQPTGDTDLVVFDPRRPGLEPELAYGLDSSAHELAPAVLADGTVYFASDRDGGNGGFDLYRSRYRAGGFSAPEPVGLCNTARDETDPAPAQDGSTLVFARVDRAVRQGDNGALYLADLASGLEPQPVFPFELQRRVDLQPEDRDPVLGAGGHALWFVRRTPGAPARLYCSVRTDGAFDTPLRQDQGFGDRELRSPLPSADGLGLHLLQPGPPALWFASRAETLHPWWAGQRRLELLLLGAALFAGLLLLLLHLGRRWRTLDLVTQCLLLSLLLHILLMLWLMGVEISGSVLPGDDESGGIEVTLISDADSSPARADGPRSEDLAANVAFAPAARDLTAAAPATDPAAAARAATAELAPDGSFQSDVSAQPSDAPQAVLGDAAAAPALRAAAASELATAAATLPSVSPQAAAAAAARSEAGDGDARFAVGVPGAALAAAARESLDGGASAATATAALSPRQLAVAAASPHDAAAAQPLRQGRDAALALAASGVGAVNAPVDATADAARPTAAAAATATAADAAPAVALAAASRRRELPPAASPSSTLPVAADSEAAASQPLRDAAALAEPRALAAAAGEAASVPLQPLPASNAAAPSADGMAAPARPASAAGATALAAAMPSPTSALAPAARQPAELAADAARAAVRQETARPLAVAQPLRDAGPAPAAAVANAATAPATLQPLAADAATAPRASAAEAARPLAAAERTAATAALPAPTSALAAPSRALAAAPPVDAPSLPQAAAQSHTPRQALRDGALAAALAPASASAATPRAEDYRPLPSARTGPAAAQAVSERDTSAMRAAGTAAPPLPPSAVSRAGSDLAVAAPRATLPLQQQPRQQAGAALLRDLQPARAGASTARSGGEAALQPLSALADAPSPQPLAATVLARRGGSPGIAAMAVPLPGSLLERAESDQHAPPRASAPLGASGAYSNRFGPARQQALEQYGGTAATERAVAQGLRYLASIQNSDGSWGERSHFDDKYGNVYIGKTALCLLAFLGAGHTPTSHTEYSGVVQQAVAMLRSVQDADTGAFGTSSAYGHGITTYALAECYGLTKDPALLRPVEEALSWILQHQGPRRDRKNEGGWGYFSPGLQAEDDYARVSVSAWMIMALESARLSGIELPDDALPRARRFLELAFDADNGWFRYNHKPSRLNSAWPTLPASTPAGAFGLMLLGEDKDSERIAQAVEFTVERRPIAYRRFSDDDFVLRAQGNVYFWYYGSLACFLHGGSAWERWNEKLSTVLPQAQADDGSFAPIDVYARYAGDTAADRSYTTAMCVLSLEVYYRYFTPLLLGR